MYLDINFWCLIASLVAYQTDWLIYKVYVDIGLSNKFIEAFVDNELAHSKSHEILANEEVSYEIILSWLGMF